jgi:AsmA protein
MKKILIGVGVLVVLIIAAMVAIPFFVPVDTIKDEVVAQAEKATGRKLTIGGPVKLSLFPNIAVEVNKVAFANAPGASAPDMVTLAKMQVALKLLPLLSGEVAVDEFILVDPVINLEVAQNGRPNWQFSPAAAPSSPAAQTPSASSGGSSPMSQLRLGDVRLENGKLTYRDIKAGTNETLDAVNLKLKLPSIEQPFDADGSVTYKGKAIKLTAHVANPRALLVDNKASDIDLKIAGEPLTVGFGGSVKVAPPLTLNGGIDLSVPSVRNLAAWAAKPIDAPGNGLGPLAIKGKVAANGPKYSFTEASIDLDAIKSKGSLEVDTGAARPAVKATLDVAMLDLNPYLPPEQPAGQKAGGGPAAPGGAAGGKADDWSDEPINLAGLKAADADMALSVGGIKVRKIEVGKSALKVALKDGKLAADLTELNLYQAQGSGRFVLDSSSGNAAGLQSTFKLAGLEIAPLLSAAADFDKLTGKGTLNLDITSRGGTQRQIVSALNGKGDVKLADGTIKGIDFVKMLCNPVQAVEALGGKIDPNAKTEYSDMGMTYTIANGIAQNKDLALHAPLFQASGEGSVDLPKRSISYRAVPKLIASCSGQGASGGQVGLNLPVLISGPWSNVSVRPDFNPLEVLKNFDPNALKGLIPGMGGSTGTQQPAQPGQSTQPQQGGGIGGALKGLLGK